jgi:hypothetical protein
MVLGAGACYDTRDHPNAYNLVHLDFDSGKGTVYLRMYSDQQGGFWTKDVLTYRNAPGEYTFDLPSTGATGALRPMQQRPRAGYERIGFDKWWEARGYDGNPYTWSNAAEVTGDRVSELFHSWHVDPRTDMDAEGLGPTPTLDKAKSPDTSRLILIFAPGGGGKTFYCRWAVRQLRDDDLHALKVYDIDQRMHSMRIPENHVTARDLAACIYDHVCEHFSMPKSLSPNDDTRHILRKCDEILGRILSSSQGSARVYVYIDDIDRLFDERPSGAGRNAQACTAIVELCEAVANRHGGEPLALRLFVPQQLRASVRNDLLIPIGRRRIEEYVISWTPAHCEAIAERRLDSRWKGGPDTGINHLSRLLTQDARDEFREWLYHQEDISPGHVVETLDRLAHCAYGRGVAADQRVGVELWEEFSKSSECTDICTLDEPYPGIHAASTIGDADMADF